VGGVAGGVLDVVLARGFFYPAHPQLQTVAAIVFPVMFVGCYLASIGACAWALWRITALQVPAQGFGICPGLGSEPRTGNARAHRLAARTHPGPRGAVRDGAPLTVGTLGSKQAGAAARISGSC